MKYNTLFLFLSIVLAASSGWAQNAPSPGGHAPGPHIVEIDYDALYRMPNPPEYKPFDFYGAFLFSVAGQKTPLALNPKRPTPENVTQSLDIEFKEIDGIKLDMDIYQPSGDNTPNPLILIIHGGAWEAGDKLLYRPYGINFAAMGYTAASINYRLSGQAPFPAAIEDIRDAIVYLSKHAAKYNIDPTRIVTFGSSAGGHLSTFTGFAANTPDTPYLSGIDAADIKAVISLYGPHDLTTPGLRDRAYTQKFIGYSYANAPEIYSEASTLNHLDENDPPVLLIHGTLDSIVSVSHSDMLSEKLREIGISYTYDRIKGWSHVMDFFSPIAERTLWQCYHFLKTHLPSDEMIKSK